LLVLFLAGYVIIPRFLNPKTTPDNPGPNPATPKEIVKDGPEAKPKPPPPEVEPEFLTTRLGPIRL
jgi:hypothetical protein